MAVGNVQGVQAVAAEAPTPQVASGGASDFGPDAAKSGDVLLDGFGDGSGYHLQVGTEKTGFAWRQVAVLKPAGLDDRSWTGYQCVSGDGKYAAVTVLPISAVNLTTARDHGAYAFGVDLGSGKVTPLASGVASQYHSPGCGVGDEATFTAALGANEEKTDVVTVDLAVGKVLRTAKVDGQLTSAVPAEAGVVGVLGSALVKVGQDGKVSKLASVGGTPFEVRAAADGGVDLVDLPADHNVQARAMHERSGALTEIAHGDRGTLQVFPGRAGHTVIVGAANGSHADGRVLADPKALPRGATGASLDGDALIGAAADATKDTPTLLSTRTGKVVARDRATSGGTETSAVSAFQPDGVATEQSTQASAGQPQPKGDAAASPQASPKTASPNATAAQTPKCAVPRLAENRQVLQPSPAQIDWAAQMAEQNLLTAANGYSRPAGFDNLGLAAYAPNDNFPKIALSHPASDSWDTVPRSVFAAIMAQESNWNQASWHALPGMASDPLIADYYGAGGDIKSINYAGADCGYGVGQATTGMDAASTGQILSVNGQTKVAVDYQENIAYALQILQTTWNKLYAAGIIPNDGSPRYLENWYFAAWAYNSGIQPRDASYGNTTGCTPSPTCTGPDGTWGLGWANNPLNPVYPPNRAPYLKLTYADAAHPGSWPYQERIMGWMASPLLRGGNPAYAKPSYHGGSTWPQLPAFATFCTPADNKCQPGWTNPNPPDAGSCTLSDYECWWHAPKTWIANCAQTCATSDYGTSGGHEPAVSDPWPPSCQVDFSKLGGGGTPIIVDEAQSYPDLNLQGCSNPNWSQGGTFAYSYGTNAKGDPIGAIDTHQLGAGLGGHSLFTHTETGSDQTLINTGTWTPNLSGSAQNYKIKLHIPSIGATATNVVYKIYPGGGVAPWQYRVNQDWQSEQWVTIATVAMQPGGYVQLTNASPTTGGTNAIDYSDFDVAFDAIAFIPMGAGAVVGGPPTVIDAPRGSNPAFVNCGCVRRTAGDPVDTSTGYFGDTFTDLSTTGRLPLSLTRSYAESIADPAGPNGKLAVDGPFGYGWTFNYNSAATTDATTGNVTITQEDGSTVTFLPQTGGGYAPSAPRYDATLARNGTTYTYTRRGSDIFTYDVASGRMQSQTDIAGSKASPPYALTFGYDGAGHLTTITDPASRRYTLTWTGNHITGLSDTAGRQVSYAYDAGGNLTDVYGVGTTRTPSLKDDDHMQYGYQAGTHLMTSMRTPKNFGVTTNPAPVTSMTYDGSERVLTQTDPMGHTTSFTYGPNGGLAAGQVLVTDPAGHQDLQSYANGLLMSETKGYGSADAGTWTYTYDPVTLGVTSVTDPLGNLQTFAYDDHGNKISSSDARGFATNYQYDDHGNLIATITPQGVRTSNNIDEAGHIALAGGGTNAGGFGYGDLTSVTTTQLAASSEIVNSGTVALPTRTVSYYYDDPAHPSDRTRTVDVAGNTATATYDAYGDMVTATNALGDKAMMGYDTSTGRVTSTVSPEGVAAGVTPGCTPPARGCVTTQYDIHGNVTKTVDPLGHSQSSTYDVDGEKLTDTDANGNTTTTGYDAAGHVVSLTRADGTSVRTDYNPDDTVADTVNAAGGKTSYTYDGRARAITRTNPDGQVWKTGYDKVSNPVTTTDPTGRVTTDSFDAAGQQIGTSYSDGVTPSVSYLRNSVGQQVAMTDSTGTSTWTYDAFGDVTSTTDGSGAALKYSYDQAGRPTGVTYPGGAGQQVTRTFDAASRLTGITDWNNNTTKFGYGRDGQLLTITYPNGTTVTSGYDNADTVSSSTLTGAGGAALASLGYTRDPANQLTGQTPTGLPDGAQTYSYSKLNQLSSVTAGGTTTSFATDPAGNPTLVGGTQQTFDAAGQLCWTVATPVANPNCAGAPTGATAYTYDGLGNRTKAGTTSTYSYDQANRLTGATTPAGTASYAYNGVGLRTSKTVGTTTTHFTWDGENLIGDGSTSYLYGPGGMPIEQIGPAGTFWYFHDQVGNTRALTDSTGKVSGSYAYTPYGKVTGHSGTDTPLQYGQGYSDPETGFVYLKSRYYDPATALFLTVDPAIDSTGTPYSYALGNPLNANDPNGMWSIFGAIVGGLVGAVVGVALVASVVATGGADLPLVVGAFAVGAPMIVGYFAGGTLAPPTPMSMPKIRIPTGTRDEPTPQNKPTEGPTAVPRPPTPRNDEDETVTIYKAPQRGMGECMYTHGFQPSQFQSEGSNGFAYFTRDRAVAEKYARSYGEGIISVVVPKRDFDAKFARYEYPYEGGPLTELEIPINSVSQLNSYPRYWRK
ncbi:RHS repeat-associated core domain-containing protein [Kutzneria sp. NPDC052558]|uniref:RHS repeat-associated core domain-containing protein n=1 Tax=Kutzneria sp. NPDC052558 TaxID=3364121 RepID=UPI0037C984C4